MSLPLLALALPRAMPFLKSFPSALALVVGAIALPCLQLIPLPPELWNALPGRHFVAEILTTAQAPMSWRPISLIPSETWRALLSLLPAVAIFLATLCLGNDAQRRLLLVVLAIGVASALLGMLQVLGGASGPYLFTVASFGTADGFFANANHLAALEYALLPLGAAALAETQTRSLALLGAMVGAITAAILLALTLTVSRSAMILGRESAAATLAFVLTPEFTVLGQHRSLAFIAALALALLPIAIGFGFLNILSRFGKQDLRRRSSMGDRPKHLGRGKELLPGWSRPRHPFLACIRFTNAQRILCPTSSTAPTTMGSGRSLKAVRVPPAFRRLHRLARRVNISRLCPRRRRQRRQARAGVIAMSLLLIHSLWDYPLRTIALETLFCFCAALQFAPPPPRSFRFRRGGQGEADPRCAQHAAVTSGETRFAWFMKVACAFCGHLVGNVHRHFGFGDATPRPLSVWSAVYL